MSIYGNSLPLKLPTRKNFHLLRLPTGKLFQSVLTKAYSQFFFFFKLVRENLTPLPKLYQLDPIEPILELKIPTPLTEQTRKAIIEFCFLDAYTIPFNLKTSLFRPLGKQASI
jgi:hypothetical protein